MAVRRVESRVKAGGHNIPVEVIHRRYERGRRNFLKTYMPLADVWTVLDNSKNYEIVAEGTRETQSVFNSVIWEQINE